MAHWYSSIPIFAGLSETALSTLAESAQVLEAGPGEAIVTAGQEGRSFFLIESGKVEVVTPENGSRPGAILATLPAGDFFGEMAILECTKRSATVRTVEPTVLHEITNADLLRLFHSQPDQYAILILNISRDLARRIHRMDEEFLYRQQR